MKRAVIFLTIIASVAALLYHLNSHDSVSSREGRATSATPSLESPPQLQFRKSAGGAIAKLDVWNLKPYSPLGQMPSLKDMFKPVYTLVTNGRQQTLQRSDRPNEGWGLQGIIMHGTKPRALLYNSGAKKIKNVGVGDLVDEQLTVKHVGPGTVTLEAKDGKKPQRFELRLFKHEKDTYGIRKIKS